MSDFLNLCGVVFNVATDAEVDKAHEPQGGYDSRAADASLRIDYQALKYHPKFTTIPMVFDEALFKRALLECDFDRNSFDVDLYSDKGNNTSAAAGAPAVSNTQVKYGANSLAIHNTVGELVTYAFNPLTGAGWTAIVWRYESLAWHWYLVTQPVTGNPQVSKDGVFIGAVVPTWLVVNAAAGTVTIQRIAADGVTVYYDDLIVVNAACPLSLMPALYAFHNAQAWPQAPALTLVAGDFHPTALTMAGKPGSSKFIPGVLANGAFTWSNVALSFELLEA